MDLKLDSGEDFPRRLEVFPKGQLLALGDDDGSLSCIDTTAANCIRTIRQYDDAAVRAATLSSDGKRVAVGFDNGSTRIYKYDEYNSNNNDTEQQQQQQHPFLPPPKANKEDDDDDDNGFLSQPDGGENDMDEEDDEDRCWAGPQVEGPVRDLKFLPNSHWLVIASESGLCVVNVESADTMADRYLQTQVTNEHDGCGIRGIAINDKKWMASLAMDGRLCVWEISGLEQLSNVTDNVPVFRDRTRCVPHKDIGESNDASPSDRSCLPHWVQSDILALPGKAQLQLRSVSVTSDKIEVKESEKKPVPDPSRGHIEPIVALTSAAAASTDDLFVVSSGQDGRVILWKILKDGEDLPTAEFVEILGQYDSIPTSLYWKEENNILYVACANGTLEMVVDMNKKLQSEQEVPAAKAKESETKSSAPKAVAKDQDLAFFDDSDDDDDDDDRSDKENAKKKASSTKEDKTHGKGQTRGTIINDYERSDEEEFNKDKDLQTQPPSIKDTDKPQSKSSLANRSLTSIIDEFVDSDDESNASAKKSDKKNAAEKDLGADNNDDSETEKDEEANTKSTKSEKVTKRLSKQSNETQEEEDDDDDIFDEEFPEKKTGTKNAFIEDEAEDVEEGDDEDEVMVDRPATKEATESKKDSAETNKDTEASQDDKQDGNHSTEQKEDDDGGFNHYDDDDDGDENSLQDDIAELNERFAKSGKYSATYSAPALPEPQAAFAPSSTPLDLPRRFLCWNNIGSITLMHKEGMGTSSVDINFTDSAFRRPISFTDNMGFLLGSLGDDGAIFATDLAHDEDDDLEEDEDLAGLSLSEQTKAALKKSQKKRMRKGGAKRPTGSSIYFHRFETFGSLREKDWYITLPDGERSLACACGEGFAAVATSRKFLRLFTSGGAQGQVLWLPGAPVTMAARNRFLSVIYHESMPLQDGTQKLGYMIYDAVANKTISKGSVSCISSGSSLSWVGFSNDCSLMAMDSDGMLSMLVATSMNCLAEDDDQGLTGPVSWEWSPLLDTVGLRKSSDDSFWPVTVFNGKLVCVPLKGGTQYPDAGRRPVTTTLSLRMPLARSTLQQCSALEEVCIRSNVALVQKKVNNQITSGELMGEEFDDEYRTLCAQVDKVTLKLFAKTVEAGKLERALDLVDRLQLEKSYELAMTIADSHDKLVDLIEDAKERRFAAVYDDEEQHADDGEDVESDHDNQDGGYDEPVGTSPEHRMLATRKISPDANNFLKAKRSFGSFQSSELLKRNVRPKAF